MKRKRYPSDLSDKEWRMLEPFIPPTKPEGRLRTVNMREVINAIFYVHRTDCRWRDLPHDFPAWSTVWGYFRRWHNDGTWDRILTALREQAQIKARQESISLARRSLIICM